MTCSTLTETKSLLAEMAAIVVMAALLGIGWNQKLLHQAWTGKLPAASREEAKPRTSIALPLGLMQVKELYDRKEALFVDARNTETFAAGHIKEAVSLPVGELEARLPLFIASVPTTAALIVYCNGYDCHDSRELGAKLLLAGYKTVYVFEGGYPEWLAAGYPSGRGKR